MAEKNTKTVASEGEKIKRTKKYREIKASLIDQIERSGNDTPYFMDLVEDYMKLFIQKEICAADIEKRGITVVGIGSTGREVTKKNDSADILIRTNQQMLRLLDSMKIKPAEAAEDDEEL